MKHLTEILDYVSISAGMALAASCYMILGQLYASGSNSNSSSALGVPLAIGVAGAFCLMVASSLSHLAATYPSSPGIRTYFHVAFGNKASFFLVCVYLAMVVLVAGVEASIVKSLLTPLLGATFAPVAVLAIFVSVIVVNLLGLDAPRVVQIGATVVLVLFGLGLGVFAQWQPVSPSLTVSPAFEAKHLPSFVSNVALSVFLFMGFEWVTPMGRSPEAYRRKIPMSMFGAILVLMVTYASIAAGTQHVFQGRALEQGQAPHVLLGLNLFGPVGVHAAVCLSVLAMLTSFNAGMMGAARMVYGLARERLLPKALAKISFSTGAPVGAILAIGSLALIGACAMFSEGLPLAAATVVCAIACLIYGLLILASIVIQRRTAQQEQEQEQEQAFTNRVPRPLQWLCGLLMPLLGLAAMASTATPWLTTLMFAGICAFGLALMWSVRRSL
jgi:amino acid transporter